MTTYDNPRYRALIDVKDRLETAGFDEVTPKRGLTVLPSLWKQRHIMTAFPGSRYPSILVVGGVHGDEVGTVTGMHSLVSILLALSKDHLRGGPSVWGNAASWPDVSLRQSGSPVWYFIPCLNPTGLMAGRRKTSEGHDLDLGYFLKGDQDGPALQTREIRHISPYLPEGLGACVSLHVHPYSRPGNVMMNVMSSDDERARTVKTAFMVRCTDNKSVAYRPAPGIREKDDGSFPSYMVKRKGGLVGVSLEMGPTHTSLEIVLILAQTVWDVLTEKTPGPPT